MNEILVIEDDPNILKAINIAFARSGYYVKAACNVNEGIELLNGDSHFDLVISEIRKRGVDGNQIAKVIKGNKLSQTIPIIAITSFIELVESGLFELVLVKPFKISELIGLVNSLL